MPGDKKKKQKKADPLEKIKLEIAAELGLLEKIKKNGWGGLSSRESGKVGGYLTKLAREREKGEGKNPRG